MAIQSFSDQKTRQFFEVGKTDKGVAWANLTKIVARKLDILDFASTLQDLKSPPGNRLEALSGNLRGYHSIRVNDQWRVIFRWTDHGPSEVRVTDYH